MPMNTSSARPMATGRFLCRLTSVLLAATFIIAGTGCIGSGSNGGDGEGPTAPAAPSGLSATSQDGAIALDWDASSGTDAYRVYRSTSSGVDASGSPLETGISSTEHVDETAENGTKYFYVVTAVATEGGENAESGPSNEVEKTPFSDPPDRP